MSDNTPVPFTVLQFLAAGHLFEAEWSDYEASLRADNHLPNNPAILAFDMVATMAIELGKRGFKPTTFLCGYPSIYSQTSLFETFICEYPSRDPQISLFEMTLEAWESAAAPLEVYLSAYRDPNVFQNLPEDFSDDTNYKRLLNNLYTHATRREARALVYYDRINQEVRVEMDRLNRLATPANPPLEIIDFVNGLEKPDIASIAPEDMACPICREDFHVTTPLVDHKPIKTPCCRQLFGRCCLVEALVCDRTRCPMCRQDIVRIAGQQASSSSQSVSE